MQKLACLKRGCDSGRSRNFFCVKVQKMHANRIILLKNLHIPNNCSTFATAIELTAIAKLKIERK